MSLSDTLKTDLAKYADPVIRALELVQSLTGVGGADAAAALQVSAAVIKTLEQGVAAQLSAAEILAQMDSLTTGEAADDKAAADANAAELAKYPTGGV